MTRQYVRCAISATIVTTLMLLPAGCRTPQEGVVLSAILSPAPDGRVLLAPGDELDIKFYYAPELSERQTVRPDGMITLQLIGDIYVAGQTPSGLEAQLKEDYRTRIENSEVTVIVRRLHQRIVYVGGAVLRPRAVAMPGNLTALAAIMEAGGINYLTADSGEVLVLRERTGGYETYRLDLASTLKGNGTGPFYLHPKDIVYVSRTRISNVNRCIDQYINKMVPQFGFTVFQRRGNTTVGVDTSN